ncbi:type VI secretion system tip protein VgrG [Ignatzschineria larvae DSM 13226]|uniref:Type VI secretion system tip protein VgrG n=1 Tax=Ignatzschineria larvae DSM 13226 TaxID=1111732 RepID=A0ABZ3C390_9GAMM
MRDTGCNFIYQNSIYFHCDYPGCYKEDISGERYTTPEPSNDSGLSCWIRVSQDWAGAGWGSMQLPRVGQEVIVTFLNGDPDQPIITGRVYNNLQTTPYKMPRYKTVTTIKSKEVKGSGYNELILDDTYTKIKAMLHSTHGASQLSLGYIKSEHRVDKHPDHRGDGFELRTDEWGAIRAGKGLYISTDIREKAEKKQLDLEESIVQLEQALALARELARAADTSQTYRTDVDNQESQFKGVYQELKLPGMLLSSPEGIALTSPKSIQASSSQNIALTSYQSIDMSSFKDFRVAAKTNVSILAVEKDLNLIANQGRMKIQAQNNELELSSKQELRVISNDNSIVIAAQNGIKLVSGGAYILIKDGKVEIGGPQPLDIKTAGFNVVGSNNMPYNFTNYDSENPM